MAFLNRLMAARAAGMGGGPVGHHGSGPFGPGGGPVLGSKPVQSVWWNGTNGGAVHPNLGRPFGMSLADVQAMYAAGALGAGPRGGGAMPAMPGRGHDPLLTAAAAQAFIQAAAAAGINRPGLGPSYPMTLEQARDIWAGQNAPRPSAAGYPSVLFGVAPVGAPGGPVASAAVAPAVRPEDYYRPQGGR